MGRTLRITIGLLSIAAAVLGTGWWFTFRIYVPHNRCAVLIRKMGDPLPPGQLLATEPGQRGIQETVLGPGRYFYNPLIWDHEIKNVMVIPGGNPMTWDWAKSLDTGQRTAVQAGTFSFQGELPKVGVVTRRVGKEPAPGQVIVDRASGLRGVLREVLTPGVYKLNPYVYDVELHPAVVIPAGFVGVVTNLFGEDPLEASSKLAETTSGNAAVDPGVVNAYVDTISHARPLAQPGQRGTLRDVLQPGIYMINPKLQKVTVIEIGYNEYSQVKESETANYRISFPSETGYLIRVGVTVVWGIDPSHAAEIINEFGNVDGVLDKVIGPQLRSICRNIGSTYAARDFIQGEKRELFQRDLTHELQRICRAKNLDVLIALVREIEVHAPTAGSDEREVTEDLKRTIQQSFIAVENQLTKVKQREAAAVRAQLEEEWKNVDVARESIRAQTRVLVANTLALGEKAAAEIEANAQLDVATIQQEVALLDAKRVEILGLARADVERMKKDAEAQGFEMLVQAFGNGETYNLYTFAQNFNPESIRLIFAGEGTFWTDLDSFEQIGPAKLLQDSIGKADRNP